MKENPYSPPEAALEESDIAGDQARQRATVFDIYFSVKGRITRKFYLFAFVIPLMAISIIMAAVITFTIEASYSMVILGVMSLPVIWVSVVGSVKRIHDFNLSGWFYLATLIPYVRYLVSLVILVLPGTKGTNDFGPDPRKRRA